MDSFVKIPKNFNIYIILGIEWKDGNVYGNHLSMFLPVPADQNF